MATSGSYDYTFTASQIITDAFGLLQIPGSGQTLSAEQTARGLRFLNQIIKNMPTGIRMYDMVEYHIKPAHVFIIGSDAKIYICKKKHTSASTSKPITGSMWQPFWDLFTHVDEGTYSITETTYEFGDYVLGSDANYYICILSHTNSAAATSPVNGTAKDLYWVVVSDWVTSTSYTPYNHVTLTVTTYGGVEDVENVIRTDEDGNPTVLTRTGFRENSDVSYVDNYQYISKSVPELRLLPFSATEIDWSLSFYAYTIPEDMDSSANDMDFRNAWIKALVYELAIMLAPCYGKNVGDGFTNLRIERQNAISNAFGKEGERGDIQCYPGRRIFS